MVLDLDWWGECPHGPGPQICQRHRLAETLAQPGQVRPIGRVAELPQVAVPARLDALRRRLYRPDATDALSAMLKSRILVLDGAMGTMKINP